MAEETVEGVNPTRMELLLLRKKISLAEKGHKLLKEKRDALAMEFMNYAKKALDVASESQVQLLNSRKSLSKAYSSAGVFEVSSAAIAAQRDMQFAVSSKNIMGVNVSEFELEDVTRKADERGFGLAFTSPLIEEASAKWEKTLSQLVELAGMEASLKTLSDETRKTRRRVNALERNIIPRLHATEKYITLRLEEINRENFFRLKIMKKKRGRLGS
ncbi:MAG: V-type ATP synthase subunit D [Methanobacteriota archaeon]